MITRIIKLVTGEELIANIDNDYKQLLENNLLILYKPRILVIGFDQKSQQPFMQLLPFLKGDMNGRVEAYKYGVMGINVGDLDKELEKAYLQETSGIQIALS